MQHLISLLMSAKFESNLIICLHLMAVICYCAKRRRKIGRNKQQESE